MVYYNSSLDDRPTARSACFAVLRIRTYQWRIWARHRMLEYLKATPYYSWASRRAKVSVKVIAILLIQAAVTFQAEMAYFESAVRVSNKE